MQNQAAAIQHLKTHQTYPATKADLVAHCNSLSDFSEDDKKWFSEHLPDGTYNSAEDVMKVLGMQEQPPPTISATTTTTDNVKS